MTRVGKGRGTYIGFTGIDGAGKSTQAGYLSRHLTDQGRRVFYFESKEEFALQIMETVSASHGHSSARAYFGHDWVDQAKSLDVLRDHLKIVRPIIENGGIVVAPRTGYCRLAIAAMYGSTEVEKLEEIIHLGGRPDLTFWMDVPSDTAVGRIEARNIDREDPAMLAAFAEVLESMCARYGWIRIDASRSAEDIHRDVVRHVQAFLDENKDVEP